MMIHLLNAFEVHNVLVEKNQLKAAAENVE
jgi:hypothetical protein